MWIEDLTKALWMLNGTNLKWNCCIDKIKNGVIFLSNGTQRAVADLVADYDREYGSGKS